MANLKAYRKYGNLVYWDTHRSRIIDAVGPGVSKVILDPADWPIPSADALTGYTVTLVEVGAGESTITAATTANGGGLLLTTDAAENDGLTIQKLGEAFQPAADTLIYFGIKLQISDATQSDILVGLCITDTDLLGGMTDGIYFRKPDGSTTVSAVLEQDSTETTATAHTLVAATDVTLEFICDGVTVTFFVDGVQLAAMAQTNVPDDELLTPSIHFLTGSANARTCLIRWMRAFRIAA